MPFSLPDAEVPPLERPPLRVALIQIRFHHLLGVEDPAQLRRFADGLPDYALIDRGMTHRIAVDIDAASQQIDRPPETTYRFLSHDERWTVILSATALAFETRGYQARFESVVGEYAAVVRAMANVFSPTVQTRFGMRYVNELEDERLATPRGLDALLNVELVRPVGGALGWDLEASLHELRFRQPDGTYVLRHGLVGPRRYLLDFDYFREADQPFTVEAAVNSAGDYHRVIESMFAWALEPEYLVGLRPGTT